MESNLENIWKLMNEFDFKFDRKFTVDVICVLCKRILIAARISSCGCRFCKKCIEQYLATDDLMCPGNSVECSEELLNLDLNISIDHIVNRKIAKLKVHCPIESCSFTNQLMLIEEHLNTCRKLATKCTYSELGCNYECLEGVNISCHLSNKKDEHIRMMMLKIEELTNKCEELSIENNSWRDQANATKAVSSDSEDELMETPEVVTSNKISTCPSQAEEIDSLKYDLNAYLKANVTEFLWIITSYSQMRANSTTFYSDEFSVHPNGAKIQLTSFYDKSSLLYYIYAVMNHGSDNKHKPFPITCDITVGIVNPKTSRYFISIDKTFTYTHINQNCTPLAFKEFYFSSNLNSIQQVTVKCIVKIIN